MNRTQLSTTLILAMAAAACGGGEPADEAPAAGDAPAQAPAPGELTMPAWMQVDHTAQTVTMDVTAGATQTLNYWNYNGAINGGATIVVPAGYEITVNFTNSDPAMAHSFGIEEPQAPWGASLTPSPVFEGAVTPNPLSMTEGTLPGETVIVTFTATTPGEYAMVCYVPGHAATGMWIHFNVVEGQEAGSMGFPTV